MSSLCPTFRVQNSGNILRKVTEKIETLYPPAWGEGFGGQGRPHDGQEGATWQPRDDRETAEQPRRPGATTVNPRLHDCPEYIAMMAAQAAVHGSSWQFMAAKVVGWVGWGREGGALRSIVVRGQEVRTGLYWRSRGSGAATKEVRNGATVSGPYRRSGVATVATEKHLRDGGGGQFWNTCGRYRVECV